MAHDLATFRVRFPEFVGASDGFVQAYLDQATLRCGSAVWGSKLDDGIMYLAAHLMAVSPWGNSAKLVSSPDDKGYQRTTYGLEYWTLVRAVSSGYRVT
jgi:hypothetical protein